jgi:hypothetical protein
MTWKNKNTYISKSQDSTGSIDKNGGTALADSIEQGQAPSRDRTSKRDDDEEEEKTS